MFIFRMASASRRTSSRPACSTAANFCSASPARVTSCTLIDMPRTPSGEVVGQTRTSYQRG